MGTPISPVRVIAALFAALAITTPFVASNEGRPAKSYIDGGGVLTGGWGHTGKDVPKAGTPISDELATQWLAEDLVKHGLKIVGPQCVQASVIVSIQPYALAAFQDFALNVGTHAFCTSTLVKKLNAGDTAGACAAMSAWVYDNGKVVQGLINRRQRERAVCEGKLTIHAL